MVANATVATPPANVAELKGKSIDVGAVGSLSQELLTLITAQVGLDSRKDVQWVTDPKVKPIELFVQGKIDAFLGFPTEPQDLRARHIGRVILNRRRHDQVLCPAPAPRGPDQVNPQKIIAEEPIGISERAQTRAEGVSRI
jgi:hypothetical protein